MLLKMFIIENLANDFEKEHFLKGFERILQSLESLKT